MLLIILFRLFFKYIHINTFYDKHVMLSYYFLQNILIKENMIFSKNTLFH
jgi:hypothetical protein